MKEEHVVYNFKPAVMQIICNPHDKLTTLHLPYHLAEDII